MKINTDDEHETDDDGVCDCQSCRNSELVRLNTIACGHTELARACVFPGDYIVTVRTGCMFRVKTAWLESREWVVLELHPRPDGGDGGVLTVRISDILWITDPED